MVLHTVWNDFFGHLEQNAYVEKFHKTEHAGIPFLYITTSKQLLVNEWIDIIHQSSKKAVHNRQITFETVFIRKENNLLVFRHRFYVPQEKMFCCGNFCKDCIRFKQNKKK
ncbi:hypothetical protein EJF36_08555 [Bacillus sp. HMF5848]|uniref:hypothetical protein n=1 Tax=Bacillus sp. HMF5848 TaxID=2495421 RepID=UPI000F7867BF|nr:hypothetical protein [Bacillus sp. HMF5848]RSK26915.1 hypothetical protein EJF36_08555 [Bacillus sp. HMF5848]